MARRLLVCGGGGFVGGHLCSLALCEGWEVHVADAMVRDALPAASWHEIDFTDGAAAGSLVAAVQPSVVVYLAAVADIDRAERERELAQAVNVDAARALAAAGSAVGAHFVYFSSDAVFAGTAERYLEDDTPDPVNWYGRTKADGERAVREAHVRATVVRISLALGFPITDGNSFLAGLARKLASGATVSSPVDEIRTPIDVLTLSAAVLELCAMRLCGTIHLGATDSVDRYTLTRKAATLMGFPESRIALAGPAEPGRAARHRRGVIDVEKARRLLATPMVDWQTGLRRAIGTRPDR